MRHYSVDTCPQCERMCMRCHERFEAARNLLSINA